MWKINRRILNSEKNVKEYYKFNTAPLITHQRYQSEQIPEYHNLGKTCCTTTLKHDADEEVQANITGLNILNLVLKIGETIAGEIL